MKSPPHNLLRRLALGDDAVRRAVYGELGRSVILVPGSLSEDSDSNEVHLAPFFFSQRGRPIIPVFTGGDLFDSWRAVRDEAITGCQLLGADLCASIDVFTSLIVDPGTDHEVVLTPEDVDEIASLPFDHDEVENDDAESGKAVSDSGEMEPLFQRVMSRHGVQPVVEKPTLPARSAPLSAAQRARMPSDAPERVPARVRKATVVFNRHQLLREMTGPRRDKQGT